MKKVLLLIAIIGLFSTVSAQSLIDLQEAEVEKLTTNTDQLRELYSDGLIARNELEKAQQKLSAAKARVEEARLEIETKKAEELAKAAAAKTAKTFVKPTLMPLNKSATVMRSTAGSWSISGLSTVQQFFSGKFGRSLPISTIGQSATHNRMRWDHRNAVDVGLHPDSAEGRALIAYLQSQGIPFLAFRGAIPGVSTGPHIHIGSPSHRL